MEPNDIRNLNEKEVRKRVEEEQDQLRQLRFQHAVAELENPMLLRQKRRLIARLKTILNEKQHAQQSEG